MLHSLQFLCWSVGLAVEKTTPLRNSYVSKRRVYPVHAPTHVQYTICCNILFAGFFKDRSRDLMVKCGHLAFINTIFRLKFIFLYHWLPITPTVYYFSRMTLFGIAFISCYFKSRDFLTTIPLMSPGQILIGVICSHLEDDGQRRSSKPPPPLPLSLLCQPEWKSRLTRFQG